MSEPETYLATLGVLEPLLSETLVDLTLRAGVDEPRVPSTAHRGSARSVAIRMAIAQLIIGYRMELEREFGFDPSTAIFEPRHGLRLRRLLATAESEEAWGVVQVALCHIAPDLGDEAFRCARRLGASGNGTTADSDPPCRTDEREGYVLLITLSVFVEAAGEAWAIRHGLTELSDLGRDA